jgi:hypothetical protein
MPPLSLRKLAPKLRSLDLNKHAVVQYTHTSSLVYIQSNLVTRHVYIIIISSTL